MLKMDVLDIVCPYFLKLLLNVLSIGVNSVQETCVKCFAVHMWNFTNHMKKMKQRTSVPQFSIFTNRFNTLMFFVVALLKIVYVKLRAVLWCRSYCDSYLNFATYRVSHIEVCFLIWLWEKEIYKLDYIWR